MTHTLTVTRIDRTEHPGHDGAASAAMDERAARLKSQGKTYDRCGNKISFTNYDGAQIILEYTNDGENNE